MGSNLRPFGEAPNGAREARALPRARSHTDGNPASLLYASRVVSAAHYTNERYSALESPCRDGRDGKVFERVDWLRHRHFKDRAIYDVELKEVGHFHPIGHHIRRAAPAFGSFAGGR